MSTTVGTGCWDVTVDYANRTGSTLASAARQTSECLGHFWSNTVQPSFVNLFERVKSLINAVTTYLVEHPDFGRGAVIGGAAALILGTLTYWLCCSGSRSTTQTTAPTTAQATAAVSQRALTAATAG